MPDRGEHGARAHRGGAGFAGGAVRGPPHRYPTRAFSGTHMQAHHELGGFGASSPNHLSPSLALAFVVVVGGSRDICIGVGVGVDILVISYARVGVHKYFLRLNFLGALYFPKHNS